MSYAMKTPFSKVLVANRGEIAMRVLRSARMAGLATVAVYSEADADAPHVRYADEALCIGPAPSRESYLNVEAIVQAALLTGAQAIHPGYGFLAENEGFAAACIAAGLVFIGPSPQAIEAMGNKAGAKKLMRAAGVPCVPGNDGDNQDPAHLAACASEVGFPLMIKAVAGGGGRGMRLVQDPAAFEAALRSAQQEALSSFGDGTVILERAIQQPRHIEIQIVADRYGHAIHLGERDCSVQRRHQKVIEEAPSPVVSPELRRKMGEIAVKAAQAIHYEGVGTLEFLLDASGEFYFMEMNTRLQVEHPVTEATTGLDLVALQFAIAAGEPLALQQSEVQWHGHAIEVRLCAEDPAAGFLPQSGTVARWIAPSEVRVDHALFDGARIPPEYDSMVAKVIAHGPSREVAVRRLQYALQQLVLLGVRTNQSFLLRCLEQPVFRDGQATTGFIADHAAVLMPAEVHFSPAQAALLAALCMLPQGDTTAGASRYAQPVRLSVEGKLVQAQVLSLGALAWKVMLEPKASEHQVEVLHRAAGTLRVAVDGLQRTIHVLANAQAMQVADAGTVFSIIDLTREAALTQAVGKAETLVKASTNGRVVAVHVEPGQLVEPGQTVAAIEAMKMEHPQMARTAGVVKAVNVAVGDQVANGKALVEIELTKV
jgi:geranyl-CoA carboxylase alpha subunit